MRRVSASETQLLIPGSRWMRVCASVHKNDAGLGQELYQDSALPSGTPSGV